MLTRHLTIYDNEAYLEAVRALQCVKIIRTAHADFVPLDPISG